MKELFDSIKSILWPERLYSWQTAISLCVLAWLMSFPTEPPIQNLLVRLGWVCLIVGVGWLTTENPIELWGLSFSPWLTGLLICIFLFVSNPEESPPRIAVILWPVIAALVAVFPASFRPTTGLQIPPIPTRTRLLVILLSNLLLMTWILFFYVMENWLIAYPGLRQEDFSGSQFVYAAGEVPSRTDRGAGIVQGMSDVLIDTVAERPRSEVERWLLQLREDPDAPAQFRDTVFDRLTLTTPRSVRDGKLWQFEIRITEPAYQISLGARWMGPSAHNEGYLMQRTCQISFINPTNPEDPTTPAQVACGGQINKIAPAPVS